ncbi:MAG: PilZ domain-containing protein [Deltaproteobacteria bacterium]|nr:PilZ domain-containing protein [Deltaproteobacteria bacterium]
MGIDEEKPTSTSQIPREPRHVVCIAAQLEDDESRRTGVTWDVSTSGALILTRGRLSLGDPVKIVLHLPQGPAAGLIVTGKVVRAEGLDSRRIGLWSDSIAIAFDEPAKTLEPTVEELSQKQAELFGQPRV